MGTYIGSPWGHIRGKLDDVVGGVWKGINWCRVRILPTQRGTLTKYRQLKDGLIDPWEFSYPQMNIRRAVLQVLGYLARMNMEVWTVPVWNAFAQKHGWVMTGANAFIKRNAARLLASMDRDIEYDPETNAPDLLEMIVADGDLEGTTEVTATYVAATGVLTVTWDTAMYTNGTPEDYALVLVTKKPILESVGRDGTWAPKLFMYGTAIPEPPPGIPVTRADGTVDIALPTDLDPTDLIAHVFFRDEDNVIGNSISLAIQVTTI